MSQESLDALQADPAAAVVGLKAGIAQALDLDSSLVEITRTVPNLLTRQLAEEPGAASNLAAVERRLETKLVVDFEVVVTEESSSVQDTVNALAAGDTGVAAVLAFSVEQGLKEQSIDASVDSAAATNVELVEPDTGRTLPPRPPPPPELPSTEVDTQSSDARAFSLGVVAVLSLSS
jgi:hypothetical protein